MGSKIRTAVIGAGYLGRFHTQKYALLPCSELVAVVDLNPTIAHQVAEGYGIAAFTDYRDLFGKIDAVSIVVPTHLHYEIAKDCLNEGIHILLEKPMTTTVAEADVLIELAKRYHLILQIGHLERFNATTIALQEVISIPQFIESHRLASFNLRGTDVSVILDLMIHDIDIILSVVNSSISDIHANGASVLTNDTDIANARIQFANGCVANVTASRVSMKSQRKMRIFQQDAYISVDFQEKKLSVYRKGVKEMFPGIPEIISEDSCFSHSDAIMAEIEAFLRAVRSGTKPSVSGEEGRDALAIALQISQMLKK